MAKQKKATQAMKARTVTKPAVKKAAKVKSAARKPGRKVKAKEPVRAAQGTKSKKAMKTAPVATKDSKRTSPKVAAKVQERDLSVRAKAVKRPPVGKAAKGEENAPTEAAAAASVEQNERSRRRGFAQQAHRTAKPNELHPGQTAEHGSTHDRAGSQPERERHLYPNGNRPNSGSARSTQYKGKRRDNMSQG